MKQLKTGIAGIGFALAVVFLWCGPASAQDTIESYFEGNCKSCHNIGGGDSAGPDLKDLDQRRDLDWVVAFLQDPKGMVETDDYARALKDKFGSVMPVAAGMSPSRAKALFEMIIRESANPDSPFKAVKLDTRPFTAEDVVRGEHLFIGLESFENGGAACVSCHAVSGLPALGGGQLGPDLTKTFEKQGGRQALAQWLTAPATPTMQATFKNHKLKPTEEILPLVAYFKEANTRAQEGTGRVVFVLLGLLGTGILLALFDVIWRRRFRGVRAELVRNRVRGKGSL